MTPDPQTHRRTDPPAPGADAAAPWPHLDPYAVWQPSAEALHLRLQVVGKYRLAHTPWINHAWHATFLTTARGWTTTLVPDGPGLDFEFDLVDACLRGRSGDGRIGTIALEPGSIAAFHARFRELVTALGGTARFHGRPNEIADPVAFVDDTAERPFDLEAIRRFHAASLRVDAAFQRFRSGFLGKASPVHLFWGSFDLAVTRFSGRAAPRHPGGIPALPDAVASEAYDREVASAGFWPGGGAVAGAAFYAYAYPAPAGYSDARVQPEAAGYDVALGEFLLPYEAVRSAPDPDRALADFLQSTYAAAADLGGWDRDDLECAVGGPGVPRLARPIEG